mmetsp:Transcript_4337/g.7610  ORF Transcript_4337/g.7610 Transcript_4337/m.7610 type:complete len:115 (-) Transcript_4337:163-507(-)
MSLISSSTRFLSYSDHPAIRDKSKTTGEQRQRLDNQADLKLYDQKDQIKMICDRICYFKKEKKTKISSNSLVRLEEEIRVEKRILTGKTRSTLRISSPLKQLRKFPNFARQCKH